MREHTRRLTIPAIVLGLVSGLAYNAWQHRIYDSGPKPAPVVAIPAPATDQNTQTNTRSAVDTAALRERAFWWALGELESGNRDDKVGPAGEVGRYQCLPSVWRSATSLPTSAASNPFTALAVGCVTISLRISNTGTSTHLGSRSDFTDKEMFLLWHCPGKRDSAGLWLVTPDDYNYATRGQNLYEDCLRKMLTADTNSGNMSSTAGKQSAGTN